MELERALSDNPHKALLIEALERKCSNNFDNFFERLISELFITGQGWSRRWHEPLTMRLPRLCGKPHVGSCFKACRHGEKLHCVLLGRDPPLCKQQQSTQAVTASCYLAVS